MKTKMLFWGVLTLLLISCKSDRIEGTYYFVDTKSKDFFELGRDMACSSIGRFEFKNGKCYINVMGVEKRLDYDVENNIIYLKNYNGGSGETGLTIVDDNTISFMGCIFKKNEDVLNENSNKTIETKEELKTSNKKKEENFVKHKNSTNETLNFLKNYKGKYPYDVKLLNNPTLKKRIVDLMGMQKYNFMKTTWRVEGGIGVENNMFDASGCEQHNCDMTNFIIVVDLEKDILYIGYRVENEIQKFGEDRNYPKLILDWEKGNY